MSVEVKLYQDAGFWNFVYIEDEDEDDIDIEKLPFADDSNNSLIALDISFEDLDLRIELIGEFVGIEPGLTFETVGPSNLDSKILNTKIFVNSELFEEVKYGNGINLRDFPYQWDDITITPKIYSGDDVVYAPKSLLRDVIYFNGYDGNDTLHMFGKERDGFDDIFWGGAGLDTLIYDAPFSNFSINRFPLWDPVQNRSKDILGFYIEDETGRDGRIQLHEVERVIFSDQALALDLDGHAGQAAKVLGAVFGADAVRNKEFAGIGLSLLDAGMSYVELMGVALDFKLGASATHEQVVELLYTNVVGVSPSEAEKAEFVGLLDSGVFTRASLGVVAADTDLNAAQIDLVGLSQTGLAYLPVI